jgi:hypothetical protein
LQAAGRLLASWQGIVLALAVVASAATGAAVAAHVSQPAAFVAEENLAPSHLLLGSH